ncbi:MAG: hypothetical protein RL217_1786 [Pseudomonadota bacterium]|jgi:cytochrome c-type biogenesis protein CcmE
MHPKRKKRLLLILFLVAMVGTAVGLLMYSLSQNINLFMSPSQIANGEVRVGDTVRAGGLVEPGSVERGQEDLKVRFVITDGAAEVTVEYDGILPDLFREGQGIVALGQLREDGVFVASQVLAKHDENYMPPEVQDALDKAHKKGKADLESARY